MLKTNLACALCFSWFLLTLGDSAAAQDVRKADENKEKQELIARCKTKMLKKGLRLAPKGWEFGKDEKYRGAPTVSYTIEPDGSVANAKLTRSSGVRKIDEYALQSVRGWKYQAMPGCPGLDSQATILIHFD